VALLESGVDQTQYQIHELREVRVKVGYFTSAVRYANKALGSPHQTSNT
jgi:hypothetical protein